MSGNIPVLLCTISSPSSFCSCFLFHLHGQAEPRGAQHCPVQ